MIGIVYSRLHALVVLLYLGVQRPTLTVILGRDTGLKSRIVLHGFFHHITHAFHEVVHVAEKTVKAVVDEGAKVVKEAANFVQKELPVIETAAETALLTSLGVPELAAPLVTAAGNGVIRNESPGAIFRDVATAGVGEAISVATGPYVGKLPTPLRTPAASVIGAAATGHVTPESLLGAVVDGEVAAGTQAVVSKSVTELKSVVPASESTSPIDSAKSSPMPVTSSQSAASESADADRSGVAETHIIPESGSSANNADTGPRRGVIVSDTLFGPELPTKATTTTSAASPTNAILGNGTSGYSTVSSADATIATSDPLRLVKSQVEGVETLADVVGAGAIRSVAGFGENNYTIARPLLSTDHFNDVMSQLRDADSADDLLSARGLMGDKAKTARLIEDVAPMIESLEKFAKPLTFAGIGLEGVSTYKETGNITDAVGAVGVEAAKGWAQGEAILAGATEGFEAGLPFVEVPVVGPAIPVVFALGGGAFAAVEGDKVYEAAKADFANTAHDAVRVIDNSTVGHKALLAALSAKQTVDTSFRHAAATVRNWAVDLRE